MASILLGPLWQPTAYSFQPILPGRNGLREEAEDDAYSHSKLFQAWFRIATVPKDGTYIFIPPQTMTIDRNIVADLKLEFGHTNGQAEDEFHNADTRMKMKPWER